MSGSSSIALLVLNPILFFVFLGFNIGLYFPGVIIVREAMIRWSKGWVSVFLLGFAYAIVEEGLALRTLYNPLAGPVGNLGFYGHWLGVNWVWTIGLLLFHSAYSIGLPILMFGLAFPALKAKSLVSSKGLATCVFILGLDTIALSMIANYDPGGPLILFSCAMVFLFALAARIVPADLFKVSRLQPGRGPTTLALLGGLFFPSTLLLGGISAGANASPWIPMVLDITMSILLFVAIVRSLGAQQSQAHKTALAFGLLVPIACFGFIAGISFPLVLGTDVALFFFSRRLWRRYRVQLATAPLVPTLTLPGGIQTQNS